ncbi:unnamed protein product [Meloidogyne enterolobii]|uniref:Uncharacterized protein n=1 Tax=Meloidogyne enterolobii TaxID=390850 RepID=A0ACB1AVA8_MELEN
MRLVPFPVPRWSPGFISVVLVLSALKYCKIPEGAFFAAIFVIISSWDLLVVFMTDQKFRTDLYD